MASNDQKPSNTAAWLGGIAAVITAIAALIAAFHHDSVRPEDSPIAHISPDSSNENRNPQNNENSPAAAPVPSKKSDGPRPGPTVPSATADYASTPAAIAADAEAMDGFWFSRTQDFYLSISPNDTNSPGYLEPCDDHTGEEAILLRSATWNGRFLNITWKSPDDSKLQEIQFTYDRHADTLTGRTPGDHDPDHQAVFIHKVIRNCGRAQ